MLADNLHNEHNHLSTKPLADRMRPRTLDEFIGQSHIVAEDKPLCMAIKADHLHSMILWGPPGSGKTTLARVIANHSGAHFVSLSAVLSGVKDIRKAVDNAIQVQIAERRPTVLFIDEVHRFNKSQQDAFLPYIEDGTIIFIGATTENPSFQLNSALLSRAKTYVLKHLQPDDLVQVMNSALEDEIRGFGKRHLNFALELKQMIAEAADGDARMALNLLEIMVDLSDNGNISRQTVEAVISGSQRRFDNKGEAFYDQISALHKSVRGSAPDAALYWLCRMLDGGCDPLYIARRAVRMASEDIGNADPRALTIALDACEVQERLGSPEGELAIAQAIVYMACAPKSNAVYTAFNAAKKDVNQSGSLEVPLHLRNASTRLMRELGYGKTYRYAHDEPEAYAAGERYFPDEMNNRQYYVPVNRGLEIKIRDKLAHLRKLDQQVKQDDGPHAYDP